MSSYVRGCVYCGHSIRMVENYHGYWQPMELDGSGRHECGNSYYLESARTGGSGFSDQEPATYLTNCWWCGEEVWYHTNGYGDHVLFDELGWPWQVHACWQEHMESSGGSDLPPHVVPRAPLYSFSVYLPATTYPLGSDEVRITGYVWCGTRSGYRQYDQAYNLSEPYSRETPVWVKLPLLGRRRHDVLIPKPIADALPNGSLVTVDLSVLKRPSVTYTIAKRLFIHRIGPESTYAEHVIHEGAWQCAQCERPVGTAAQPNWGFQKDMRVVCAPCAHRSQPLQSYTFYTR